MTPRDASTTTRKPTPIVSQKTRSGEIIEMLFRRASGETRLVTVDGDHVEEHQTLQIDGQEYIAYSAQNNLLTHRVLRLASEVGSYESVESLVGEVRAFIHRYVDLSDSFEELAAHYVLLTWVYDRFNELPYLRVRGDYGSGKSRFLLTIGSICWKPIFASGASTVSPIFRLIDQVGGTLVVDEADFWATDERAEIVKILNNGNARGFPVLRSEVTPAKEFSPRAFNIFGPKIIATRHPFEDEALESRCLTEVLGVRSMRRDIPITLPSDFDDEAQALLNKLLRYRFDHADDEVTPADSYDAGVEPRKLQMLAPMLQVATSDDARDRMRVFVGGGGAARQTERENARLVLAAVAVVRESGGVLTIGTIAERLRSASGHDSTGVTDRWVGAVLRRLGLEPQKSNGVYRLSVFDRGRLEILFDQYGVRDVGDIGDHPQGAQTSA